MPDDSNSRGDAYRKLLQEMEDKSYREYQHSLQIVSDNHDELQEALSGLGVTDTVTIEELQRRVLDGEEPIMPLLPKLERVVTACKKLSSPLDKTFRLRPRFALDTFTPLIRRWTEATEDFQTATAEMSVGLSPPRSESALEDTMRLVSRATESLQEWQTCQIEFHTPQGTGPLAREYHQLIKRLSQLPKMTSEEMEDSVDLQRLREIAKQMRANPDGSL